MFFTRHYNDLANIVIVIHIPAFRLDLEYYSLFMEVPFWRNGFVFLFFYLIDSFYKLLKFRRELRMKIINKIDVYFWQ